MAIAEENPNLSAFCQLKIPKSTKLGELIFVRLTATPFYLSL